MSITTRKLKDGIRYRYDFMVDGRRHHSAYEYLSKADALEGEKAHRNRLKGDTLGDLFQRRLEDLERTDKSKDYLKETRRYFEKAKKAWGKDTRVKDVSKQMAYKLIRDEADRLNGEGKGNHKVNSLIRVMRAFFYWVIDVEDIEMKNPFKKMKLYSIRIDRKYIPSDWDLFVVRQNLTDRQRKFFDFVDETGCRVMEAARLTAEDVTDDTVTLWTRKAKNSNLTPRVVPRPQCLLDKDIPVGKTTDDSKVFPEWDSYPRFLEEAIKTANQALPEKQKIHWSWHNLRHRRASLWAGSGMTTFEIMSRLGHNNLSTTMGYLQQLGISRT